MRRDVVCPYCCSREQALVARSCNTNSIKPLVNEHTRIVYYNEMTHARPLDGIPSNIINRMVKNDFFSGIPLTFSDAYRYDQARTHEICSDCTNDSNYPQSTRVH